MSFKNIAIDGPSGAGKSTMAKRVAQKLNYLYVDTGAIYRTVGLYGLRENTALDDGEAVAAMLPQIRIEMDYGPDGTQRMHLNGEDVSAAIRQPEVSIAASKVSALPAVRAFLLDMQRNLARTHNVIMDGRDIGTVVLPDADVKIFLTASAEERAKRRYLELQQRGIQDSYETVLADIKERDLRDTTRAAAPLRQADDAQLVDTTGHGLEASMAMILQCIREKLG